MINGPDGADREPLGELDGVDRRQHRQIALKPEGEFDGGNLLRIAVGEVSDVAFADMGAVAVGLAEVNGEVGFAVGGGPGGTGDLHDHHI